MRKQPGQGRRCDMCGCYVTGNEQAWQTHAAGIRHRRNLASCKVFGEPGHAVVSAFEAAALGPVPPPRQYRGKDAVLLAAAAAGAAAGAAAVAGPAGRQAAGSERDAGGGLQQQLRQLQQRLCKQLAHAVGVGGHVAGEALQRFGPDRMRLGWDQARQQLQGAVTAAARQRHRWQQQQGASPQQPGHQQQQQSRPGDWVELELQQAAELACLALAVPDSLDALQLTVPLHTFGPAGAAMSAAMAVFAASLAERHGLRRLRLVWRCDGYGSIQSQGGAGLAGLPGLWRHSVTALTAAMQVNCGLERLELAAYPGQLPADDLVQLQLVMATARRAQRAAVLMGSHPRLGVHSPLRLLPPEVLRLLLDAAVPATGCVLQLDLPPGLLAGGAADGSSDDGSSDDEDSSDDDSSDDDEDTSSSDGDDQSSTTSSES